MTGVGSTGGSTGGSSTTTGKQPPFFFALIFTPLWSPPLLLTPQLPTPFSPPLSDDVFSGGLAPASAATRGSIPAPASSPAMATVVRIRRTCLSYLSPAHGWCAFTDRTSG